MIRFLLRWPGSCRHTLCCASDVFAHLPISCETYGMAINIFRHHSDVVVDLVPENAWVDAVGDAAVDCTIVDDCDEFDVFDTRSQTLMVMRGQKSGT